MAITRTPIIDDDGTGRTGTIIDNSWKQEFYSQIDAATAAAGIWQPVPWVTDLFSAASGGTWTVTAAQLTVSRMRRVGQTYEWAIEIDNSTIGGAPTALYVTRPFPEAIVRVPAVAIAWMYGATGPMPGYSSTGAAHYANIFRTDFSAVPAGAFHMHTTLLFEVS